MDKHSYWDYHMDQAGYSYNSFLHLLLPFHLHIVQQQLSMDNRSSPLSLLRPFCGYQPKPLFLPLPKPSPFVGYLKSLKVKH
ncbi:unnamed protein product [Lupinus luteus]|uniref:Uncharacterized protein n=1 Tax=Lupinus luteus TaxID=3873 RepID=A0AAV1Y5S8_LUPLU